LGGLYALDRVGLGALELVTPQTVPNSGSAALSIHDKPRGTDHKGRSFMVCRSLPVSAGAPAAHNSAIPTWTPPTTPSRTFDHKPDQCCVGIGLALQPAVWDRNPTISEPRLMGRAPATARMRLMVQFPN
jgi:hypothetical protein